MAEAATLSASCFKEPLGTGAFLLLRPLLASHPVARVS